MLAFVSGPPLFRSNSQRRSDSPFSEARRLQGSLTQQEDGMESYPFRRLRAASRAARITRVDRCVGLFGSGFGAKVAAS